MAKRRQKRAQRGVRTPVTPNSPAAKTSQRKQRLHGTALEDRRRRVYLAWCQGKTQLELAEAEQVDHRQIGRDLAAMFQEIASTMSVEDRENARLEMLARIAHAEAELLAAWERSKQPRQRTKRKRIDAEKTAAAASGKRKQAEAVPTSSRREGETVTEGRDGNPRFMEALKSQWELKAKLLGLIQNRLDLTSGGKPLPPIAAVEVVQPDASQSESPDGDHA